ncbi:hypothetical protein Aperf_G00000047451 [Anoplocephala perfoliata]
MQNVFNLSSLSENSAYRYAALEAFIPLPSPRQLFLRSGSVLQLGADPVGSASTAENHREDIHLKLGLCLELDVRFSFVDSSDASKLTVKFRSTSQTISASKVLEHRAIPTSMPSIERKFVFLSYLASWIFSMPSNPPAQLQSQRHSPPHFNLPTDQWLHFITPLDTLFFQPESPLPFALYGYNGVCIDSLRVESCVSTSVSSLSWPPNNTFYLAFSLPTVLSSSGNDTGYFTGYQTLFTGAFLFIGLLVLLLTLLILICVMSVACGRRRRAKGKGFFKKGKARKIPLSLANVDLLRSPSVSSLPAAVVHQRPIDEISYCIDEYCEETDKDINPENNESLLHSEHDSLGNRRSGLRRPQRRTPRRAQSVVDNLHPARRRRQQFRRELSEQLSAGGRDKRQSTSLLTQQQSARSFPEHPCSNRRSTEAKSPNEAVSRGIFQRFSLLLSINENNELVLVSPESAGTSANHPSTRNISSSPTNDASGSAGTTGSSISASTNATGHTTTPAGTTNGHLSSLEAEATLQEMAASVFQLGRGVIARSDEETDSSPSIAELISDPIVCFPPPTEAARRLVE